MVLKRWGLLLGDSGDSVPGVCYDEPNLSSVVNYHEVTLYDGTALEVLDVGARTVWIHFVGAIECPSRDAAVNAYVIKSGVIPVPGELVRWQDFSAMSHCYTEAKQQFANHRINSTLKPG